MQSLISPDQIVLTIIGYSSAGFIVYLKLQSQNLINANTPQKPSRLFAQRSLGVIGLVVSIIIFGNQLNADRQVKLILQEKITEPDRIISVMEKLQSSNPIERVGIKPAKCRSNGRRILLAPPSQKLLNLYDIDLEQWLETTLAEIAQNTDRPVVVRRKPGRTARTSDDSMEAALSQDIYCLITFSSIAAGEALIYGKPAITLGPNAAAPLCSQSLTEIEYIKKPSLDEIHAWCRHMAYCQFTEPEMRDGTAWRILQGG